MRSTLVPGAATAATMPLPTSQVCAGCGYRVRPDEPLRLRCPAALVGDDVDHLLRRELDTSRTRFPSGPDSNPFVRYRTLLHAYQRALAQGWTDARIVELVERFDGAVAAVNGRGFSITPLLDQPGLAGALGFEPPGGVLVKDETGNVSGSHKARHLFGALLAIELAGIGRDVPLAIASCGNAALAAAVVARAAGRPLRVFIPPAADPLIVERLRQLEVETVVCERLPGTTGDPTYHRLRTAIDDGALAFTCQGDLDGFAIEGGLTLGYELADQLRASGRSLDRLIVQVGGGALASSVIGALRDCVAWDVIERLPRIHAVQTRGAYPLARAYDLVAAHLVERLAPGAPPDRAPRAERLWEVMGMPAAADELRWIARHRSRFMWPWETEPHSVAEGILDDETYDWLAVVEGMLRSGGFPIVVDEETLVDAELLARDATGIAVSATGSAGLAGLLALRHAGIGRRDETVGLLFTGIDRHHSLDRHHSQGGSS